MHTKESIHFPSTFPVILHILALTKQKQHSTVKNVFILHRYTFNISKYVYCRRWQTLIKSIFYAFRQFLARQTAFKRKFIKIRYGLNFKKPTGWVHQQVWNLTNVRSAHTLFICFVCISEQTATCATYSINWLVFIPEMKSVYSTVRTGSLNKAYWSRDAPPV
jgi:hypothetical protein